MLSHVRLLVTPETVACEAPLSMGFSRQEYWSELPFPSPEDCPDPGVELCLLYLLLGRQFLYHCAKWETLWRGHKPWSWFWTTGREVAGESLRSYPHWTLMSPCSFGAPSSQGCLLLPSSFSLLYPFGAVRISAPRSSWCLRLSPPHVNLWTLKGKQSLHWPFPGAPKICHCFQEVPRNPGEGGCAEAVRKVNVRARGISLAVQWLRLWVSKGGTWAQS